MTPRTPSAWLRIGLPALLVIAWLAAAAIGGPYFGRVDEVSTNDQSTYLPSSAEATQVADRLAEFRDDDTIPAAVVVTGDGQLTPAQLGQAQQLAAEFGTVPGVVGDVSPAIPSEDGQAVQIIVPVDSAGDIGGTVESLRAAIGEVLPEPLQARVTGPAGFSADLVAGFLGIDGILLLTALVAVFVILVIVYRSPLLPVLVLLASTFALSLAILVVWWLARLGVVVLNGQNATRPNSASRAGRNVTAARNAHAIPIEAMGPSARLVARSDRSRHNRPATTVPAEARIGANAPRHAWTVASQRARPAPIASRKRATYSSA